jgi:NACalpha-BTF3-like transcription factor
LFSLFNAVHIDTTSGPHIFDEFDGLDVSIVMEQAQVCRELAIEALKEHRYAFPPLLCSSQ